MAKYRNSFDKDGTCSDDGYRAETLFMRALKSIGDVPERIFDDQQQMKGIDIKSVFLESCDVKSMRRIARDDNIQDKFIWVEFKNVGGGKGWLYGDAEYIAFERSEDFIIVKRSDLADLCEVMCNVVKRVWSPDKALYQGYRRRGRRDLISMIQTSDLEFIPHFILEKL